MKPYQENFSNLYPAAAQDVQGRRRKAATVLRVLADFLGEERLEALSVLDVGAGTGYMDHELAPSLGRVLGLDIDAAAIDQALRLTRRDNLEFRVGNGLDLPIEDGSFDVVLCAHVYEHVPDPLRLMDEINRVLRPGGICYFAAGNRYQLMEPHYGLPLLSMIPKPLAHLYLKIMRRGSHYYEQHLSYWELRRLVSRFVLYDYTVRLINEPSRYCLTYLMSQGSFKHRVAKLVAMVAPAMIPTYIWVLQKR